MLGTPTQSPGFRPERYLSWSASGLSSFHTFGASLPETLATSASSTQLPRQGAELALLSVAINEGQGQFFQSYDPRGSGHPTAAVGEEPEGVGEYLFKDQLSYAWILRLALTHNYVLSAGDGISSSAVMHPGPAIPQCPGEGWDLFCTALRHCYVPR